jgi:hypothetical protein
LLLAFRISLFLFQEANPERFMVAYLPADLSKKGLDEFTTHSGEFSIVPNSPPEPRAIFIFKVFLKFLLRNMDYYCSADAVLFHPM